MPRHFPSWERVVAFRCPSQKSRMAFFPPVTLPGAKSSHLQRPQLPPKGPSLTPHSCRHGQILPYVPAHPQSHSHLPHLFCRLRPERSRLQWLSQVPTALTGPHGSHGPPQLSRAPTALTGPHSLQHKTRAPPARARALPGSSPAWVSWPRIRRVPHPTSLRVLSCWCLGTGWFCCLNFPFLPSRPANSSSSCGSQIHSMSSEHPLLTLPAKSVLPPLLLSPLPCVFIVILGARC